MTPEVVCDPKSLKALDKLPKEEAGRIAKKVDTAKGDLKVRAIRHRREACKKK